MQSLALRYVLVMYLIGIHAVWALMVFAPETTKKVQAKLGLYQSGPSEFYTLSIPPQLRLETQLPKGAVLMFGDSIVEGWWRDDYPWPVAN